MLSSFYRNFTFTVSFHAMNFHPKTVKFLITLANRMTENPNLHIRSRLGFSTDWERISSCAAPLHIYLRFFQPLLELLQRDTIPVAFLFLFSGLFTPGVELTVADAARLDPRKAPLVFPAVCLEYRVIGLFQCPLPKTSTLSTLPLTQTDEVFQILFYLSGKMNSPLPAPKNEASGDNPEKEKAEFPATGQPVPVARSVAACEPLCGLAGTKEGNHSGPGRSGRFWPAVGSAEKWAGKTPGVVNAPAWSLLPAVRAVAGAFR